MAQLIALSHVPRGKNMRLGHNTRGYREGGISGVIYHRTEVVTRDAEKRIVTVRTGGWRSRTTKERVHHGLIGSGLTLSTHDLPGKWRLLDGNGNAFTMRGNTIKLQRDDAGVWSRLI
jgi:hypothetical protein